MAINLRSLVAELDTQQLRRLAQARRLEEKKVELKVEEARLQRQLRSVSKKVTRLERRIDRIVGQTATRSNGGRSRFRRSTRRRSGKSVPTLIVQAFKDSRRKTLRARDVISLILKKHPHLCNIRSLHARVAQALSGDRKRFKRVKKGVYTIKTGISA